VGELVSRSEADLLDIRNFGAKSIDEVKAKLVGMGLALKDSPPGFDPSAIVDTYGDDYDYDDMADVSALPEGGPELGDAGDDGRSLAEDERY